MAKQNIDRKIAVIFATDVVGYSKHMESDESETIQSSIEKRNSSEATSVKLQFRVGINSGDVVKEKDNLLGDGVNIASRL